MIRRRLALVVGLLAAVTVAAGATGCSPDPPLEVLLIGDSILTGAAPHIEAALEAQPGIGDVEVLVWDRPGTGLLTPDLYDWIPVAESLVRHRDPAVVGVLFIGNYTATDYWIDDGGRPVEPYGDAFFEEWGEEADRLTDILERRGARVGWVTPVPMLDGELDRRADRMTEVVEAVGERNPDVFLIDGFRPLATADGNYAATLPGPDGAPEQLRTGDTVHLTDAGGRRLADAIAEGLAPAVLAAREEPR